MNYKSLVKVLLLVAIVALGIGSVSAGLFYEGSEAFKGAGEYEVGTDIPAGEYYIKSDGAKLHIEISSNSTGQIDNIISNLNTKGGVYVTVSEGESLTVEGGEIYKVGDIKVEAENGYYPENQWILSKMPI